MKKILITLILLVALAVAVTKVSAQSETDGIITTTAGDSLDDSRAGLIAAKFKKQIEILSSVKLDPAVLSNSSFLSLEDRSKTIPDEPSGRANPFAPF